MVVAFFFFVVVLNLCLGLWDMASIFLVGMAFHKKLYQVIKV